MGKAILDSLRHYPQARNEIARYKCLDSGGFSPTSRQMWALVETPDGEHIVYTIGAPKACLEALTKDNPERLDMDDVLERYKKAAMSMVSGGVRSLGIMRKRESEEVELLGLLPLIDALRWDAGAAISAANGLGVDVKVLAGDASIIVKDKAEKLGLNGDVITLPETLREPVENKAHDSLVDDMIVKAVGYSEVFPGEKVRLVQVLQRSGRFVGITGDGTLDAPCLKLAQCGIAVEGATERA